jgi:hypothetical protein
MPKWMPLLGGMVVFVAVIGVLLLWLIFGGATGKQRGLVVQNLRDSDAVLVFDDGQQARFRPGESQTLFAIKSHFPQTVRVQDAAGALVFEERIAYPQLVAAEFRIGIGERIVFPVKPPGS